MRIGYLLNTYPQPSVTFVRREIRALEQQGISVHRFAMRSDRDALVDPTDLKEYDRTELILKHGGLALGLNALAYGLRHPRRFAKAAGMAWRMGARAGRARLRHLIYLVEAACLARRVAELEIDHVHAHFGTNPAAVALLMHQLSGAGYSFTVHGPEEFDSPVALALKEKVAHARFAVAISSHGRSQLYRWAEYRDWPKIDIVHCGIDPDLFTGKVALPVKDELRLVNIGRFAEQKGQLLLPEAVAIARAAGAKVHVTLVGDGEMRPQIEAAIDRFDVSDAFTLTGWLDEKGVRDALADAHALVLPSFAEGLPMVVMEAMAAGRAVIATYIAGNPELVLDGVNGWLVPAGDPHALAHAMITAHQTEAAVLAAMGDAGRGRVLARHDINQEAGKLARLFQKAIAQ
ncbi:glycosyltransferase family 4 protein [Paracoccus sp. Z330]|uniref:Glycosyltransferase family 4 protein n=1 Tax=Paracoccus onchidii TaxID=3017813 RepID=A0ABT4ZCB3_9RHOB|nr:glycosyltransferase family 4 protein [Paracoccus onchidii]MDB6176900.1 glycosyltransferase family 4 protein [Paracoccus onchidii]